jgi:hypothetical protein
MDRLVCDLVAGAISGVVLSLVALFPPVRRARKRCVLLSALVAFLLASLPFVVGSMYIDAISAVDHSAYRMIGVWDDFSAGEGGNAYTVNEKLHFNRASTIYEVWKRQMVPPPMRKPCYAADETLCRLADSVESENLHLKGWNPYRRIAAFISPASLTCAAMSWYFATQRTSRRPRADVSTRLLGYGPARTTFLVLFLMCAWLSVLVCMLSGGLVGAYIMRLSAMEYTGAAGGPDTRVWGDSWGWAWGIPLLLCVVALTGFIASTILEKRKAD